MKYNRFLGDKLKNRNKQMRSVWYIPTTPKSEKTEGKHPTQKPLKLLNRIVLASTTQNDLILDPFTGSSTTGLVATKHGRNFVRRLPKPLYKPIQRTAGTDKTRRIPNKTILKDFYHLHQRLPT